MRDDLYDLGNDSVKEFLRDKNAKKAAIQLPSGLRPYVVEISQVYQEVGVKALFLSASCYGACDLRDELAETIGCDVLVHYGHSDMRLPTAIPTLYVEARMEVEPFEALEGALPVLTDQRWGLVSTVQHVGYLEEVKRYLGRHKVEAIIGKSGSRSKYEGQILGCDWGAAKSIAQEVDGFVYLGTGEFHPRGIALATDSIVVSVNPATGGYEKIKPELNEFLKKRFALMEKARSGESFGLVVSSKKGQYRLGGAEALSEKFTGQGYASYILIVDEIGPELLENYQLDAYVNFGCPRIAIDDSDLYEVPFLTVPEAEIILDEREWASYTLDEISMVLR